MPQKRLVILSIHGLTRHCNIEGFPSDSVQRLLENCWTSFCIYGFKIPRQTAYLLVRAVAKVPQTPTE